MTATLMRAAASATLMFADIDIVDDGLVLVKRLEQQAAMLKETILSRKGICIDHHLQPFQANGPEATHAGFQS
jgi:hypothetical protein